MTDRILEIRERWRGLSWHATTQGGIEEDGYTGPGEVSDSLGMIRDRAAWVAIAEAPGDIAHLLAENQRLRAVADAARTVFRENERDPYGNKPERYYAAIRALQDAVDALDAGGEAS